jgi:tRNA pseudouridine55 synthase
MGAQRNSRREARQRVDGVLVVDKPSGMTSHDVVAVARRALGERRIGHTGTLDPLATGVLPLACGRATRLIRFLESDTKDYEAVVRFGSSTDTYDVTGTVTHRTDAAPTPDQVETALASLRGDYLQTPPAFSAKKVGGERAYALARRKQPVALEAVPVRVTRAELIRLDGGAGLFAVTCSAGFYVRTFAHALGELTGTGACLEALRRTRSGVFTLASAITLGELERPGAVDRVLVTLADLLPDLPTVWLTDEGMRQVEHGRDVGPAHVRDLARLPEASGTAFSGDEESWVKMFAPDGRLAAMGRTAPSGALHPSIVLI